MTTTTKDWRAMADGLRINAARLRTELLCARAEASMARGRGLGAKAKTWDAKAGLYQSRLDTTERMIGALSEAADTVDRLTPTT